MGIDKVNNLNKLEYLLKNIDKEAIKMSEFNFNDLNFNDDEEIEVKIVNENVEEDEGDEGEIESTEDEKNGNSDELDDFDDDDTPSVEDLVGKTQKSKGVKNTPAPPKVEPKPAYTGPRKVIVYGEELFVENDSKVTNEEIRQRIYNNFQYKEFTKERAIFELIPKEQILHVSTRFEKKG